MGWDGSRAYLADFMVGLGLGLRDGGGNKDLTVSTILIM